MNDTIDAAREVRDTDQLDLESLSAYLTEHLAGFEGPLEVKQFPSGYSNLTYLLKDGPREYVLRRPPRGANVQSGHDMSREWNVLSALAPAFDRVPTPLLNCVDLDIIGAPFYVMQRVRGVILRGADPQLPGLDESAMRSACHALIDTLADIHALDLDAVGLSDFGRPEGYIQRQVEGWARRWERAKTDEIPAIDRAIGWLTEHMPDDLPGVLIHNDFKYDNVVYPVGDFTRVAAVLDWELATIGDPLMDLGTSLAYWIEPEDDAVLQNVAGPTARAGNLRRTEVAARYAERTGTDVSNIVFYYVFGLFKIAVIGQQIYHRYKQGHSSDPRFAGLIFLVNAAGERAERALASGEI